jgi:HK97 family phage major capsid protein
MTATATEKSLREMSLEELDVRGAELRAGLSELHSGERNDEFSSKMATLLGEVEVLDKVYTLARMEAMAGERKAAEERAKEEARNAGPRGALVGHAGNRSGSFGERLFSAGVKDWLDNGMRNADGSGNLLVVIDGTGWDIQAEAGFTGFRAVNEYGSGGPGNAGTGTVNALLPTGQPIAPVPRQARLAMRDLIPSQPTTLSQIPYVRELTPTSGEGGATAVAEGDLKPDASPSFDPDTAKPTVIAVSMSPSKQLWEDGPLIVAYINQRLPYLVRFREDAQFSNGPGGWPNIQGLRNRTGVQSQSAVSGEYAQTIGNAIAKVENADGVATGVVLNPTDAWAMFTKRAAGGSGTFDAGNPFSITSVDALTVWGLPTVRTRAYPAGEALVGDYAHGAMILDREGVNVQIFPQHSDYPLRNRILVLAEERTDIAVWRPDLFVKATLA